MAYTLRVEKQGRPKRQGGWVDRVGHYHWYCYGRQGWRIRPALVTLVGDGGQIRVPATCISVADALDWLRPKGARYRQGHLYFIPLGKTGQRDLDSMPLDEIQRDVPISGQDAHIAELLVADYRGKTVVSGVIHHTGTEHQHETIRLVEWCWIAGPRSFATQWRIGD